MPLRTPSRARVAGVACASAALVLAAVPVQASAAPVSLELDYTCNFPLLKPQPLKLTISTDIPSQVNVGQFTGSFKVDAVANVSAGSTRGLRGLEAVSVEGTALAFTDVLLPGGQTLVARIPTTVAKTDLPVSGAFDTAAVGSTPSLVFQKAGEVKLNVRDLVLTLTARLADGTLTGLDVFETECFQDPGQANTLATIKVVDPSTPTPTPTLAPTPTPEPVESRSWGLGGLAYLKTLAQGNVAVAGSFTGTRDATSGALSGALSLNPARANLKALNLLPVKASFVFNRVGDATGSLVADTLNLTTRQDIRLTNVSVFGINLVSGTCHTSTPATIALKSAAGSFPVDGGGTALSTFAIPSFTGCGPLGAVVTGLAAGGGNALSLKFTPKTAA